jgi:hypothetical protein
LLRIDQRAFFFRNAGGDCGYKDILMWRRP